MRPEPRAFTFPHGTVVNVLVTDVVVFDAFDPRTTHPKPDGYKFTAIWDTGATATAITQRVVDELKLKPIGMTTVSAADGDYDSPVFKVNVGLPNKIGVPNLNVTLTKIKGADVLVGMDIISRSDFAITNKGGTTIFSFRIPSTERIDFEKQPPSTSLPSIHRNAPCICGSGLKFKQCCGKT